MVKHNCPFLQHHKWCDIKRCDKYSKDKAVCIYNDCTKCPHYQKSLTKLKYDDEN